MILNDLEIIQGLDRQLDPYLNFRHNFPRTALFRRILRDDQPASGAEIKKSRAPIERAGIMGNHDHIPALAPSSPDSPFRRKIWPGRGKLEKLKPRRYCLKIKKPNPRKRIGFTGFINLFRFSLCLFHPLWAENAEAIWKPKPRVYVC
jgi:hypothetical protein